MKNRHNWSVTLVWNILLLMVLVCTPVTALAAGQTTSDTEAVSEASPDEASEQTSSEEEWAQRIAEELHQRAAEEEPAVTAFLKTMESEHAHLEGLEYRLKSIPSLCRKILLLAHKNGETPEEAKSRIGDALRYTLIIEDPFYTAVTKETLDSIINKGYTLTEFENYWAYDARAYQGINCNLACPNGMIFELQFHTPISYETKGEKTHVYYEIIRDENSSPEEKEKARQKHDALFAMIPVPEGVRELSYDVEKQTQEDVESTVAETETEAIKLDPISGADIYETDDSVIVPMDSLRVTEDVTEEGVGRALSFIEKSKTGDAKKREPLTVIEYSDGIYSIIDGNNTYTALKQLGAKNVPVEIVKDPFHKDVENFDDLIADHSEVESEFHQLVISLAGEYDAAYSENSILHDEEYIQKRVEAEYDSDYSKIVDVFSADLMDQPEDIEATAEDLKNKTNVLCMHDNEKDDGYTASVRLSNGTIAELKLIPSPAA